MFTIIARDSVANKFCFTRSHKMPCQQVLFTEPLSAAYIHFGDDFSWHLKVKITKNLHSPSSRHTP